MIQSEKLLGTKTYTLTVTTNPSSATCTLTYDGEAHSAKTAEVKAGTVISYSIYHSTYGTTTGSITMDSNRTLTCNGTYSTSTSKVFNNSGITNYGATYSSSLGQATNFPSGSYIQTNFTPTSSSDDKDVEMVAHFKSGSSANSFNSIFSCFGTGSSSQCYGFKLYLDANNAPRWVVGRGNNSDIITISPTSLSYNYTYWLKGTWSSSAKTSYLYGSTNGNSWTLLASKANNWCKYQNAGNPLVFGARRNGNAGSTTYFRQFNGTIYMIDCYVKIGSSTVWQGWSTSTSYTYYWNKTVS